MMGRVRYRIYQNFLMRARLDEYDQLLRKLKKQGYCFLTVADLARCVRADALPRLACTIRMDVDSDIPTARKMFEIALACDVRATYYFRRSISDQALMRQISACGSEVGFHYEELATAAKRLGLRDKAQVDERLPEIRADFAKNITIFAEQAGNWPITIASHGDWINRLLSIPNTYAIDQALRERFNIVAEAYDHWLNQPVKARFSDTDAPNWWKPSPPDDAIAARVPCLYFLVHPRQWRANAAENLRLDALRVAEGSQYLLRRARNEIIRYHEPAPVP